MRAVKRAGRVNGGPGPPRRLAPALLLLVVLSACSGGERPTGPGLADVRTVRVTPASADLDRLGATLRLRASAFDSAGREVPVERGRVTWSVTDTLTASVDGGGLVTTRNVGDAGVTARVAGAADTAELTVVRGARVASVETASPRTWPGETTSASAVVVDASGRPLEGARARWSVADTAVAEVSPEGRVTGRRAGRTRVVASVEFDADTVPLTVATAVEGSVRTLSNGVPSDAFVFLRREGGTDSARVEEDGGFVLRAREPLVGEVVDVFVDRRAPGPRPYFPALWSGFRLEHGFRVEAVLFPTTWTVQEGELAGERVPLSLQTVFAYPNAPKLGDYYAVWKDNWVKWREWRAGSREGPRAPSLAWPRDSFPLPVFFVDTGTVERPDGRVLARREITAGDSAVFWENVGRMEARLGRDLFRPARAQDLPRDTVEGNGVDFPYAVRVEVAAIDANGAANLLLFPGPYPPEDLIAGRVIFRSTALFDASTVPHEMLHVLGFYHACFPSSVAFCDGPYPFQRLPTVVDDFHPTRYDATYVELLWTAHRELVERSPNFGLVAALNGERVFMLGREPVSASWTGGGRPATAADRAGWLGEVRSDGWRAPLRPAAARPRTGPPPGRGPADSGPSGPS